MKTNMETALKISKEIKNHAKAKNRVTASCQYGRMMFLLTDENEIVFRDDSMTWDELKVLENEVNLHLS